MFSAAMTPADCAGKIRRSKKLAVLTGAGISTSAGVPDFRGPKGLYVTRAYDPETVFDIGYFSVNPAPFYDFTRDFLAMLETISPTPTHLFLARLEAGGKDIGIVTQNIDGLHQRAGSKRIYPIHGDYSTARCRKCGKTVSGDDLAASLKASPGVPACPACGGVVKPDVVFFGENVRHLDKCLALAAESDLLLVLGSSLAVHPAASIPHHAGGEVIVVNRGPVALRPAEGVYLADAALDEFFAGVESRL
ncbi:MAG: Sir2 family NAD-dependent protein deacetylase [Planctomycetota bacterium]|jgi:NAD-dependent deacetylase|nr:Sir2 family NAD-dependent protein deacetylase [Planctomycetota bacterium]